MKIIAITVAWKLEKDIFEIRQIFSRGNESVLERN